MSKFDEAKALLKHVDLPFIVTESDDGNHLMAKLMFDGSKDVFHVCAQDDDHDTLTITSFPLSVSVSTVGGIKCTYAVQQGGVEIKNLKELANAAVETAKVATTYMDLYKWCSDYHRSIKEQQA